MTSCQESLQRGSQELLPGLFDELVLTHVVSRLSWENFYVLSCVSRAWLHSVRTRQVYDARVASHSTATVVVSSFAPKDPPGMIHCLSSGREDPFQTPDPFQATGSVFQLLPACRKLPPIPYGDGQLVCSDGYIYRVGVVQDVLQSAYSQKCSDKVFVFDVAAGQKEWKECASMNEQRCQFGFAAMHGKLYVFGGLSADQTKANSSPYIFCGSEMYDPEENRWSPVKPMITRRFGHNVHIVGDKFFVQGGYCFDDMADDDEIGEWCLGPARSLEVYHPVEDDWRMVDPFRTAARNYISAASPGGPSSWDFLFVTEGNLYSMDCSSIYIYTGGNSWTHLHSFSFPVFFGRPDRFVGAIKSAIVIDGELLIKADWRSRNKIYRRAAKFETRGFCGENREIILQVTTFDNDPAGYRESSKLVIQL